MPDLGFGNNLDNNKQNSSSDLQDGDISVLAAVVNRFFGDDNVDDDEDNDEPLHAEIFKGRVRSNSMPELSSKSSRYGCK